MKLFWKQANWKRKMSWKDKIMNKVKTDKLENEYARPDKFKISDLLHKEDWLAIWAAFLIIAVTGIGVVSGKYDFQGVKFETWGGKGNGSLMSIFDGSVVVKWTLTFLTFVLLYGIGHTLQNKSVKKFVPAFIGLFVLTSAVRIISAQSVFSKYLEYAFWALVIGLFIANTIKTPVWMKPALHPEFYIKTGLVIMGAEVLFSNIQKFGLYGLGIAWIVTPVVIIFMWFLGTKILGIKNKSLVITMAAATSVCGTSAAVATAAASKAKKTDLTLVVGTSLIFTVAMMVTMPLFIKAVGMNELMGGAWIGGTVDSTGAVVLAGQALGDLGGTVAALVKMVQNILIGFIALAVAVFFSARVNCKENKKTNWGEIWQGFPKFILGFLAASFVFSFILQPGLGEETTSIIIARLGQFKNWAFALAFTSIGLETNFKELREQFQGGKTLALYVLGQMFNLLLTYIVVWILLSGRFFPIPDLIY